MCLFTVEFINTALRISSLYVSSGVLINERDEVNIPSVIRVQRTFYDNHALFYNNHSNLSQTEEHPLVADPPPLLPVHMNIPCIYSPLGIQLFAKFITCICIHRIKISISIYTAHIIHSNSNSCFYTSIDSSRIKSHATPSTDTDNTNALWIYIFTN